MTPWLIYFSFLNSETQIKETWRILVSLAPFTWAMKRKSLLLVITGVAIAIIIALALNIHMKLSAWEPEGHGGESAEEVLNEIITGKPSHSE